MSELYLITKLLVIQIGDTYLCLASFSTLLLTPDVPDVRYALLGHYSTLMTQ